MISNYNLSCDYHNFELKDKIYLIPDYALKVIYTDGFNEVVFSGNSANVTILEGYDISFQEETSFDERFKFSKSVSIKVEGYITFNDLYNRYCVILETKEGEFYLVNVDFPSYVTHTYSLANGTNSTELVFSSQSNIATLKLTNFNPNNVNSCKQYSNTKIKNVKLTEAWASYLSTWQKSLVNKGEFVDIEPLPDSISLTEEFDGEKYTVTLGFDIPMSYYKNDWHIKLLQFEENKYRGYIELEDGNVAFVGYNVGLFPSYAINGDIISIKLQEVAIRGISYGNDYVLIDTDIPNTIEYNGASCYTYNWLSTCDWHVVDKPDYITITPTSGQADTQYELTICNTDDETGYEVSEFIIKSCHANARAEVIISNPIYRWVDTQETMCVEIHNYEDEYLTFVALEDNAIFMAHRAMYYSLDNGNTWTAISDSGITPYLSSGSTIMWKNEPYMANHNVARFSSSSKFDVEGNIMSVVYGDNFSGKTSLPIGNANDIFADMFKDCTGLTNAEHLIIPIETMNNHGACASMFKGCTSLVTAPELPATTIWPNCYWSMFAGCTSLIEAPVISATTLSGSGCCINMFAGCTSLTTATVLPATGLTMMCYQHMFSGCTSLVNLPANMLPAMDLADLSYYRMFEGCTSLTTAPQLPATGLTESCYSYLFNGCTSLTTVNVLPATSLQPQCYLAMFEDCTSLTTVPANMLPATYLRDACYLAMFEGCTSLTTSPILNEFTYMSDEDGFYNSMFEGCTSLNKIICLSTLTNGNQRYYYMRDWVKDVASSGTFIKASSADWGNCGANGIPCGWEVYDYATERTISGTPYCTGYDEYVDVYDQVSSDYGVTWETTATTTELVDECAIYCGCYKILMYGINDDNSISGAVSCNNSSSITYYEVNDIAGGWGGKSVSGYQHVVIGSCCTSIGSEAFCTNPNNQFSRPTIEDFENFDRITSIGNYGMALLRGLKSIDISNVTSLGSNAFKGCYSLEEITIPSGITSISAYTFDSCRGLTSVTIEEGIEVIGAGAFEKCSGLTEIVLPDSITSIGNYAFENCSSLSSITVNATTPPTLGNYAFRYTSPDLVIYVPSGSVNSYKSASGWSGWASIIEPIV